jgi:hypothetical protein
MELKDAKLGQAIWFAKAYRNKPTGRFSGEDDTTAIPFCEAGTGVVVGIRRVIMGNYLYRAANNRGSYDDYEPAYATGDYEQCLLVVSNIRHKPFLVRPADAETIVED